MPTYYLTGLALLAAACAGVVIPAEHRVVSVAGVACVVLWLTALNMILASPPTGPKAH